MEIPLIVRLQGTKEQEAKQLIKESGMAIFPFDGLDEVSETITTILPRRVIETDGSRFVVRLLRKL